MLIVSTLAFTVCFMVWMMFGVIGIPIKKMLNLNATEFGLLTSMPVLTGSLVRVPLGIWTDKVRRPHRHDVLMALTVPAIWLMESRHRILAFPRHRPVRGPGRRLVLGRHAPWRAGSPRTARAWPWACTAPATPGAAVNKFVARCILVAFGWTMVPQVYASIMLGTLVLFWLFSHSDPDAPGAQRQFTDQLKALKDPRCSSTASTTASCSAATWRWRCGWCSTTWASTAWTSAWRRCCLLSLPGGVLRAIGGVLSDKFGAHSVTWWVMWVSWICLFLLSLPADRLHRHHRQRPSTFHIGLNVPCSPPDDVRAGMAGPFGKASVFKYISDDTPTTSAPSAASSAWPAAWAASFCRSCSAR